MPQIKTHHLREVHKALDAMEAMHISKVGQPSRVDHGPFAKFHDTDYPGECPICEMLTHVKTVRAALKGETVGGEPL